MKNVCLCVVLLLLSSHAAFAQQLANPSATPAPSPDKKDAGDAKADPGNGKAKNSKGSFVLPPEKRQPVKLVRFDKPPVIDGKLDDEVWKSAIILKDFYQVQPGDNIAPSKPTEVMLGYDAKFLYVAFHCYDEPDKVRSNISKRDHIFDD